MNRPIQQTNNLHFVALFGPRYSLVGRAPAYRSEGHRFESRYYQLSIWVHPCVKYGGMRIGVALHFSKMIIQMNIIHMMHIERGL